MRAVVCLGNPGPEYAATRHNAGFILADALAHAWKAGRFRRQGPTLVAQGRVAGELVVLLKPETFMNRSGAVLGPLLAVAGFDPARDLLVVSDDFALPLGRFRLRPDGSSGGHNGLESIELALGSRKYARLRIGVGPLPEGVDDWADFVLAPFEPDERDQLSDLIPDLVATVECWVADGVVTAMNRFNRKVRGDQTE